MRRPTIATGALWVFLIATPVLASTGPVAVDDHVETDSGTVQIYVLDNDTDADNDLDTTSLTLLNHPSKGNAVVISSGRPRIKYSPKSGKTGEDHLTYQVCDSTGLCATATVTVNILQTDTTTSAPTTVPTTTPTTSSSSGSNNNSPTTAPNSSGGLINTPTTGDTTPPNQNYSEPNSAATTTPPPTDAAGEAVLASPTTNTSRFGDADRESPGIAATLATLWETGAETVRIAAVPAVMGAGIAGFLASGLPKDILAAILGWFTGRIRRNNEEETDHDKTPGTRH